MVSKPSTVLCQCKTVRCTPAHWSFTHTHTFQFISNVVTAMASIETVVDRLALIWPTPLNASITFSHCVTCVSVFVCLRWLCVCDYLTGSLSGLAVFGDVVSLSHCVTVIWFTYCNWMENSHSIQPLCTLQVCMCFMSF